MPAPTEVGPAHDALIVTSSHHPGARETVVRSNAPDVADSLATARSDTWHDRASSHWRAQLRLEYRHENGRSFLVARTHTGPLVVQKSLYPEGSGVCQTIIVHPPGGIAGGDSLAVDVSVGPRAHAQFTTPGAAKWYRSVHGIARQVVALDVAEDGVLEWLPQESIIFDGALAEMDMAIDLAPGAIYVGWDIVCLGRTASGERFSRGRLRQRLSVRRAGALLFAERSALFGDGAELASPVALNAAPVFGTLLAIAPDVTDAMLATWRDVEAVDGDAAVTRLPGLMVARYRGASCEAARRYFASLWARIRPPLVGRDAVAPRLWST